MSVSFAAQLREEPIDALQARFRYYTDRLATEQHGPTRSLVGYWLDHTRREIEQRERMDDPITALYRTIGRFDTERIKSDVRIVDIVSLLAVTPLIKQGRRYLTTCTNHDHPGDDSTPSMVIYPDSDSYYCYGCSAGGDVLTYYQRRFPHASFNQVCRELLQCLGKNPDAYRVDVPQRNSLGRRRVA